MCGFCTDDVYEVESLEAFRFSTQPPYHLLEILIKWRGYSPDENTWEPRKSLDAPMDSYSWSKQAKKDYEENLECKRKSLLQNIVVPEFVQNS